METPHWIQSSGQVLVGDFLWEELRGKLGWEPVTGLRVVRLQMLREAVILDQLVNLPLFAPPPSGKDSAIPRLPSGLLRKEWVVVFINGAPWAFSICSLSPEPQSLPPQFLFVVQISSLERPFALVCSQEARGIHRTELGGGWLR